MPVLASLRTMWWTRREFMRLASMAGVGARVPLEAQQSQAHRDIPAFDGSFLVDDASLRMAAADGGRILNRPPIGVLMVELLSSVLRSPEDLAGLTIWAARALSGTVFATGRFDLLNVAVAAAVLMVVGAVAVLPAARRAPIL